MAKQVIRYTDFFSETMSRLHEDGLLLVSSSRSGAPNVMTIGWGSMGVMWGRPMFTVMVRPSRYTYKLLEELPEFTVNVPSVEMAAVTQFCGTVSGADHDKFRELHLDPMVSREVVPPIIRQCVLHYECRVVHKCDMTPETLIPALQQDFYPRGNFHRYYFGEIVVAQAEDNAYERLSTGLNEQRGK